MGCSSLNFKYSAKIDSGQIPFPLPAVDKMGAAIRQKCDDVVFVGIGGERATIPENKKYCPLSVLFKLYPIISKATFII